MAVVARRSSPGRARWSESESPAWVLRTATDGFECLSPKEPGVLDTSHVKRKARASGNPGWPPVVTSAECVWGGCQEGPVIPNLRRYENGGVGNRRITFAK